MVAARLASLARGTDDRDSPGFTLTTVLTLAIGIGATVAIFTVVNAILIKPLPFPEADRLVSIMHRSPRPPIS